MSSARPPVVAGMFYPYSKDGLQKELEGLFRDAKKPKQGQSCIGVVSPHAGYAYSGKTAAVAIASLRPVKSFIILGPNHNAAGAEFAILRHGVWATPLGECKVDTNIAKRIECGFLKEDMTAHIMEHSIEVQLPFLQHRFGSFEFVPISITNISYSGEFLSRCEELGKIIAKIVTTKKKRGFKDKSGNTGGSISSNTGLVASSDFSHYIPAESAERIDKEAIQKIIRLDVKGFFSVMEKNHASICGYGPVAVLMSAAKQLGLEGRLLEYTNSGEMTGDFSSVVAYTAIGFG